ATRSATSRALRSPKNSGVAPARKNWEKRRASSASAAGTRPRSSSSISREDTCPAMQSVHAADKRVGGRMSLGLLCGGGKAGLPEGGGGLPEAGGACLKREGRAGRGRRGMRGGCLVVRG